VPIRGQIFAIAKEHIESPRDGLVEFRRLYNNEDDLTSRELYEIAIWAAYFGDQEFALNAIDRSVTISNGIAMFQWLPVFHEVRQLPRFKEFMKEIGLVDYWKEYGWPDLCHPVGDDDFVCD